MRKFQIAFLLTFLVACGAPGSNPDAKKSAEEPSSGAAKIDPTKYQYVGTYENFATPMGGSVSVLMTGGKKIKIASVDDTKYINIDTERGNPALRVNGTYGINGNHKESSFGGGAVFIVREMEYLSGGLGASTKSTRSSLPDFFEIDVNAKGPVTRSELNILFPDSLKRYFTSSDLKCFYQQVDIRAADLGEPATLPPIRRVLLSNSQLRWSEMTDADKRLQLARYVISMALSAC